MKHRQQGGFTLIELALVLGVSVMVAGALIGMFQAHVKMLSQAVKNNFLAQDAPFIGLLLTRTIGSAEDYRIYATGAAARSGTSTPTLVGQAVKLWMRQPNSTFRLAVVSFEPGNAQPALYFFLADSSGTFSATPSWELAGGQLNSVTSTFNATSGILVATLNGSNNDWYKFSAEKK
jgi:Prokaryotic N-terminal methylation motif